MSRAALLLFGCLVLAASAVQAQQPVPTSTSTPIQDAQALSVLSSSLAQMGTANAAGQNTVAQGAVSFWDGTSGSITVKGLGPDHVREDVAKSDGDASTYAVSKGNGSTILNGARQKWPLWITAHEGPDDIPAFSRALEFTRADRNVTYVGLEQVNGSPAHHVRITAFLPDAQAAAIEASISEYDVFIDASSLLVVKTQKYIFSPETLSNRSLVETYYDQYQNVSGVEVPFHNISYIAGQKQREVTFTSVSVNAANQEADFQ